MLFVSIPLSAAEAAYDIVVYGGTSSGVMAAVQARRMGKTVVLIEPGKHLGGMAASGLGLTDIGRKALIGGLAREFYQRAYCYYQESDAWRYETREEYSPKHSDTYDELNKAQFFMEPSVAEKLFDELVVESGVTVVREQRLNRQSGVKKEGTRIVAIELENGDRFAGRMFIDATYEGDLMAASGVSYIVGREPNQRYRETLNGIRYLDAEKVDPYVVQGQMNSGLLPGIANAPPGREGDGDERVQPYNFRVCLTDVAENRVPIERPENYDPLLYELSARDFEFRPDHFPGRSLLKLSPMPNRKTDSNNHSRFSTDFVGQSYDWPEASYAKREEIWRKHRDYTLGYFWFLGNDPRVPEKVREETRRWGLPKDEFQDSGHWPWQIYVREARRLVGAYVVTEHDCTGGVEANDPVAMGSYHMDSHQVSRYVDSEGKLHVEGGFFQPVGPFGVSYRAIVPKAGECDNLFVTVALSASHVAYGSVRMEPVFMILGQSAGTAAAHAIDQKVAVQAVNYHGLRAQLLREGQVLSYTTPVQMRKELSSTAVRAATETLLRRGLLQEVEPWVDQTTGANLVPGEKVGDLLIATAQRQNKAIASLADAVKFLVTDHALARGDYWRVQAEPGKFCNGRFVAELLIALARLSEPR